jgi:16S rRNA (guanine966-N2)-methyltransferase
MFSILADRLQGAEVADLCCGAGGLGIEALSRGAVFVHFVDVSSSALRTAGANLAACGAPAECFQLHRTDARRWLRGCKMQDQARPLCVLADPPYGSPLVWQLLEILQQLPGQAALRMAILEVGTAPPAVAPLGGPLRWRIRRYGGSWLIVLEA